MADDNLELEDCFGPHEHRNINEELSADLVLSKHFGSTYSVAGDGEQSTKSLLDDQFEFTWTIIDLGDHIMTAGLVLVDSDTQMAAKTDTQILMDSNQSRNRRP